MVKRLIVAALAAITAISLADASSKKVKEVVVYDVEILRVVDGDTVVIKADWLLRPLKKELAVRIYGVDTPEKNPRAKCEMENAKAQMASGFTKKMIEISKKHQVVLMDWDKYGGRVLGDIVLDYKSLREMLLKQGHAREYYGEAKQSWC